MSVGQPACHRPRLSDRGALVVVAAAHEDGNEGAEGRLSEDRGNTPEQTAKDEEVNGLADGSKD